MLRAWAEGWEAGASRILLDAGEAHHLGRVRRARAGEPVEVLNGRGAVASGRWLGLEGKAGVVEVTGVRTVARPEPRVRLAVAPPKAGAWSVILEQAVELGVEAVTPLVSGRTELRLDTAARRERWLEKGRATLREAAKQSGNPWLPALEPPAPFAGWLARAEPGWVRLRAGLEAGAADLGAVVAGNAGATGWEVAIGPEGDFTPAEAEAAAAAGVLAVNLGPWVLRTETAAVVAAARLRGGT